MPRDGSRMTGRDAVVSFVLFLGTVAYLVALPHTLGASDEGLFLYEAQQLLAGRVLYRDMFEIIPPGSFWLMAALFRVFGTDVVTAKLFHAGVQGGIVVLVYTTLRALGVRATVAVLTSAAQLVLFESAWGDVSPHWLSTLLAVAIVRVLVPRSTLRSTLTAGMLVGALFWVQHQKAAATAAGTGLFLVLEAWLVRADGLVRRLAVFAGGVLVCVAALVGFLLATAGAGPPYHALIEHPLLRYRPFHHIGWAGVAPMMGLGVYTWPAVLRALPLVVPAVAVYAVVQVRRGDRTVLRRAMLLIVMALTAMASIAYYPDVVHVGYIGAVFLLPLGVLVDAACAALVRRRSLRLVPAALGVALAVAGVARLRWRLETRWTECRYPVTTPSFGVVALCDPGQRDFVVGVRAHVDASGARELFMYPAGAGYYLLTGTVNPTPFDILFPDYSFPEQFDEAIQIMDHRRVPWIVAWPKMGPDDRVLRYVAQHYRSVDDVRWNLALYRRAG